jgi:hypothetical protein
MIVSRATSPKLAFVPETLTTAEAAVALNRKPQTLRMWACHENGPIRPVRVHGRLAWPANQIAALLSGGAHA